MTGCFEKALIIQKTRLDSEWENLSLSLRRLCRSLHVKSKLIIFSLRLLALLPLRAARALGRFLGELNWRCGSRMRAVSLKNLELCFPEMAEDERQALARRSVRETFATIAEGGAVWLWPAPRILERIRHVEGFELLRAAHAQGRGAIVVGPHLGNWELIGLWLNTCGLGQTVQLFQAPRDPALARLIFEARSRSGAAMVPTDARGVTQLLKSLREGRIIGILPDQVPPDSGGEFAPFFGVPALTMTLLTRLVQKTGARAVMGYTRRLDDGFAIVFREVDPRLYSEDLQTSLQGLNASVERCVREVPEQYQWEYKRFKRQPPDVPRPY